jgi:glycosyltransferase involved in cell wall biosynthesis
MATKYGECIKFHDAVPITQVRRLMREHDIYVLSSNSYEGWGAVVSEALEEGMKIIGTHEAGASASILPDNCLFHAGDWQHLLRILQSGVASNGIGFWTAEYAAQEILRSK